ncbi:MAG: hypothetical protein DSY37_04835, partial [Hyperthermus sp.]
AEQQAARKTSWKYVSGEGAEGAAASNNHADSWLNKRQRVGHGMNKPKLFPAAGPPVDEEPGVFAALQRIQYFYNTCYARKCMLG